MGALYNAMVFAADLVTQGKDNLAAPVEAQSNATDNAAFQPRLTMGRLAEMAEQSNAMADAAGYAIQGRDKAAEDAAQ